MNANSLIKKLFAGRHIRVQNSARDRVSRVDHEEIRGRDGHSDIANDRPEPRSRITATNHAKAKKFKTRRRF